MATSRIDNATPLMATHPLEVVKDEIKARGMTQGELASRLGMKASNVSRLFKEMPSVTVALAEKLEQALGIEASFWLTMQDNYNKDTKAIAERDKKEQAAINTENMLSAVVNMKELYDRLKIDFRLFIQEKLTLLEERLGAAPTQIPALANFHRGEYKRSDKLDVDEKNMLTWATLALISAREHKPIGTYKQGNAKRAAAEIAKAVHGTDVSEASICHILSENGISYSVVEKLPKTPVDGYSTWVEGYPAIVTTHRRNDMSCLVFNIMHELGHIELHMGEDYGMSYIAEDGVYSSEDQREKEANSFAEDMLIGKDTWKRMMKGATVNGLMYSNIARELKNLADSNHLNFGIVSWRYRHESKKYAIKGMKAVAIH